MERDTRTYCQDRAAPAGSNRYYAIRMAEPGQRDSLLAVHAFYLELTGIPLEVSEPGVAAAKLDWWREEIRRSRQGEARHPVARLLEPLLGSEANLTDCLDLADGVALDLDYGAYPSFRELADYCHATGGPFGRLLARVCGQPGDDTTAYSHDLGMGLRLQELLMMTRQHARRGRCYLPEDEMRAAGVKRGELMAESASDALRHVFRGQAERIHSFLGRAEGHLDNRQRRRQRSNIALAALYRALLAEVGRSNFPLLEERQELTPIRRLWIAWRASRRAARRSAW